MAGGVSVVRIVLEDEVTKEEELLDWKTSALSVSGSESSDGSIVDDCGSANPTAEAL